MPKFAIWVMYENSSGKGFRHEVDARNEADALKRTQKVFGTVGRPEDHPNFRTYQKELGKLSDMGLLKLSHPLLLPE